MKGRENEFQAAADALASPFRRRIQARILSAGGWYIYFDNVAGLDRTRWLPNLANPFYFNELWTRVTGFDRHW